MSYLLSGNRMIKILLHPWNIMGGRINTQSGTSSLIMDFYFRRLNPQDTCGE